MLRLVACLSWLGSGLAFAGSWSSGGSELLRDTRNPWFLGNTSLVSYCVLVDAAQAEVSPATAGMLAKRALDFWRREFRQAGVARLPAFGSLGIATQVWEERVCDGPDDASVDVRFQFGVLSPTQERYLQTPATFAAVSVRTEYDHRTLRAKGFIYLSPLSGPLAYAGAHGPLQAAPAAERYYALLQHELGHVFGLPHVGVYGLMAERFADSLSGSSKGPSFERFFRLPEQFRLCPEGSLAATLSSIFGSGGSQRPCLRFLSQHDEANPVFGPTHLSVFATAGAADDGVLLGSAELTLSGFFPTSSFSVWFDDTQQVFSAVDLAVLGSSQSVSGAALLRISKSGTYRSTDGAIVSLIAKSMQQGEPTVQGFGIYQGQILELPF